MKTPAGKALQIVGGFNWKTMAVLVVGAYFIGKAIKDYGEEKSKEAAALLDPTSKSNVFSKLAEGAYNPGGVKTNTQTGGAASIGSDIYLWTHPELDPGSPRYMYKKDAKGNYVNLDAAGKYIGGLSGIGRLPSMPPRRRNAR